MANRRVFDKVWEEVQRLVATYRLTVARKLKDIKGISSNPQAIDTILDGEEYRRAPVPLLMAVYSCPWTSPHTRSLKSYPTTQHQFKLPRNP
jgi:hypothetical protein